VAEPDEHRDFHLPPPSGTPIVVGAGTALILFGFVPDARIWRLALVSIGVMIVVGGAWRWLVEAMEEYRNLPD
jgi:hypothetical protein